ncbi:phosphatidylinositol transfer protein alpha isoform-like isoform X2 [Panonychus citri]|uniref:phosphatidylinositol transfer protein alpha isoform-like isoform X2 n=1 Tax=Panonychus citri TaxID=50023 RepID=UPI00230722D2|nr:phosphatidylinositol transfer protein alpha isoform-like isoform X2 [Panonychus citri]
MVLIKEYRVLLPMTVEEYKIGQLFAVAEASKNETGGGEGVEVIKNEPFSNNPLLDGKYGEGQYTFKIYHLQSKVPSFVKYLAPKGSLAIHEEAWNAYPYCKTILTNPSYMKDGFHITIESLHLPDDGKQENVHQLAPNKLKNREVQIIDIANDPVSAKDYKESEDPTKFKSIKTGRGPLAKDWVKTTDHIMCCYKLVTVEFKWRGLQNRIESFIHQTERRLFLSLHRQIFCWIDRWYDLTIDDIRAIEEETKRELNELRKQNQVRGRGGDE